MLYLAHRAPARTWRHPSQRWVNFPLSPWRAWRQLTKPLIPYPLLRTPNHRILLAKDTSEAKPSNGLLLPPTFKTPLSFERRGTLLCHHLRVNWMNVPCQSPTAAANSLCGLSCIFCSMQLWGRCFSCSRTRCGRVWNRISAILLSLVALRGITRARPSRSPKHSLFSVNPRQLTQPRSVLASNDTLLQCSSWD